MNCLGCYKENVDGYCYECRKLLFDGKKVSTVLDFDTPKAENFELFEEQTKRLSISGVQLKYSLRLEGKNLVLTEKGGQYILKPIPSTTWIENREQAPENEHLTMQIARQIFNIPVAPNALIWFHDKQPGYITRRFDVKQDGSKWLQEDFAQISGKSKDTHGKDYKYDGTYEEIGLLIKEKVAAYPSVLEEYFKLVVFNYLFSNGDAHLKNFSLIQSDFGDFTLSPAYDLMSSKLHTLRESDTALQLFAQQTFNKFYAVYGYVGRPNFEELVARIGIVGKRAARILDELTCSSEAVHTLVHRSFLNDETKLNYLGLYNDKLNRLTQVIK